MGASLLHLPIAWTVAIVSGMNSQKKKRQFSSISTLSSSTAHLDCTIILIALFHLVAPKLSFFIFLSLFSPNLPTIGHSTGTFWHCAQLMQMFSSSQNIGSGSGISCSCGTTRGCVISSSKHVLLILVPAADTNDSAVLFLASFSSA